MRTTPRLAAVARLVAPLLILMTAAAACTSGGEEPRQQPSAAEQATDKVEIRDFLFAPEAVTVPVGATVTWTNRDEFAHNVVADDRSWRSDDLGKDIPFTHTFDTAGTFSYYCGIHNYMTGRVVVR